MADARGACCYRASMNRSDIEVLRELAKQVREIASLPVQEERRTLWKKHNSLQPVRPMVLLFPEGAWPELVRPETLRCTSEEARRIEWELRIRIYGHEHFADDTVVEPEWRVQKAINTTGWGLEARQHESTTERGAWAFEPVLNDRADLEKLRTPVVTHDAEESQRRLEASQELFGDILEVRLVGKTHISYHLMQQYTYLRGLEQMMIDMFDDPQFLHDTMELFVQGHQSVLRQYQDLSLLELNNDSTYHSGGCSTPLR